MRNIIPMRRVVMKTPPRKIKANAMYLIGERISFKNNTANTNVNNAEKFHSGITLETSSTDKDLTYRTTTRIASIPAVNAAIKIKNGTKGNPNIKINIKLNKLP